MTRDICGRSEKRFYFGGKQISLVNCSARPSDNSMRVKALG